VVDSGRFLLRCAKFDHLSPHKSAENQLQNCTLAALSAPSLFLHNWIFVWFQKHSSFVWLSVQFTLTHLFPSMTVFMIITDMLLITLQNHLVLLLKEHILLALHLLSHITCFPKFVPYYPNRIAEAVCNFKRERIRDVFHKHIWLYNLDR
jgi:hypothetical protein